MCIAMKLAWFDRPSKKRVDIMKNYMANKSFSRGVETLGAEASMVFVGKVKDADEEVTVHAITVADDYNSERQTENLQKIADACLSVGIQFTWEYDTTGTKHDRDITTDHGWKLVLSRGIDVFQRYELNETFNFANRLQQYRPCKEFNVTYVRVKPVEQKN